VAKILIVLDENITVKCCKIPIFQNPMISTPDSLAQKLASASE
jgi:hypothetical protein